MLNTLRYALYWFFNLLEIALLIRAITSWFYSIPIFAAINNMATFFTEPLVAPVRNMLNKIPSFATMPIDFSVILTWILLDFVKILIL